MGTCACSENACLTNGRFSVALLDYREQVKQMHNHNYLEIYFSVSEGKRFIIDDTIYPMCNNDVFIINQFQTHLPVAAAHKKHLRYVFTIMPDYLESISSPSTNLLHLFYDTKNYPRRIPLKRTQREQLIQLIHKLGTLQGYGMDLMENSLLVEVLFLLIHASRKSSGVITSGGKYMEDVLHYIDASLERDLSLDTLSAEFYLSKGYFCRVFKEHTGITVNKYILAKRIARAKQLLSVGCSVQETASMVGFNDYASFIRRFKSEVGISPKRYSRSYIVVAPQAEQE
ncbi:AraC family transcriptional regulator [Oscillospiraceae bacterium MB08-C2-2]|nr:AraC family transcriptional regulator [Oscillospiraceae bacterium MB08-C2-2]